MNKVEFNMSNDNPFYGMKNCLTLFENTGNTITTYMLDKAYEECNTEEKKKLFYSILFSIGDITSRQHNIFKGKKRDNGGNANREGFHTVIDWLWNNNYDQFCKFLVSGLFNEYSCFDLLLRNRVKTDRKGNILKAYSPFSNALYKETIVSYLYAVINGTNPYNKHLVAKFLTLPRLTHRKGHKKMLKETYQVMWNRAKLLESLSRLMGWEYELTSTKANFKGYREWRQQYNGELESVLFSTGKINEFTKDQFLEWLDKLPSQARFRVKNRILYSKRTVVECEVASPRDGVETITSEVPKYPKLKQWYEEWEKYKEQKQQEQRKLEEKIRQNQATEEDIIKLQKVKKEAKVTVGATNFKELYNDILYGNVDKLKLESFMDKVNLPYNSLVFVDMSGSMWGSPFNFATFIASVCLVKNPDDDARNLIGMFGRNFKWYSYIDSKSSSTPNSLLRKTSVKTITEPLVNPTLSFYDNYKRISSFLNSKFEGGYTHIDVIPEGLRKSIEENPEVLDSLKSYPIWTILSDGDFNNMPNPKKSMEQFMDKCEKYLGYRPFVVVMAIDKYNKTNKAPQFEGIDNFMYIPSNPAQIEQFLTNFKDMEKFDAYTPLLSIYRSNRYDLVRNNVI